MNNHETLTILNAIHETGQPVGATFLSSKLNIPQTSIGRVMLQLEEDGLLVKVSNKGRALTPAGLNYLKQEKLLTDRLQTADQFYGIVESTSHRRLLEILRIRKLLEPQAIEEACQNADEVQLAELKTSLDHYNHAVAAGYPGNEEDLALHLTIARISGNLALYQILKMILSDDNGYLKLTQSSSVKKDGSPSEHTEIVLSMLQKDADKAKAAMVSHLNSLIRYVEENRQR